jgi:hypothetical protein
VCLTPRNGMRKGSRRIRSRSDERRSSSSPTRREGTGGAGRGSTAHRRRGEGRRRAAATLSMKGKQMEAVASPGVASFSGELRVLAAASILQLGRCGGESSKARWLGGSG